MVDDQTAPQHSRAPFNPQNVPPPPGYPGGAAVPQASLARSGSPLPPNGASGEGAPVAAPLATGAFAPNKTFKIKGGLQRSTGGTITKLTLRNPTAMDLFEVGGKPVINTFTPKGMVSDMNPERLRAWINRLVEGEPLGADVYRLPASVPIHIYNWLMEELNEEEEADAGNS